MTSIIRRLAEKIMSSNAEEPPAKRQKMLVGASDRITVDVGGTKFITSVSTLTSNSEYFASLLSGNWAESSDNEIFLDRNPSAFGKIIEYMREGMIKVDDIDESVLTLAEFLGIERLILAIKVRWYHNIGKGPIHSTDDEIASAFDQKYGGIMNALSAGLFQYFLKPNENAEKDFAYFIVEAPRNVNSIGSEGVGYYTLRDIKIGGSLMVGNDYTFLGALNTLYLRGYNVHERQFLQSEKHKETFTFSRRRHSHNASNVFITNDNQLDNQRRSCSFKEFAISMLNRDEGMRTILAPGGDTHKTIVNTQCFRWLEEHGFVTREEEYEELFQKYFSSEGDVVTFGIFSRDCDLV